MSTRQIILENKAFCKECRTEVVSKHQHDFQECNCGNLAVAGGRDYIRRVFRDDSQIEERSVFLHGEDEDQKEGIGAYARNNDHEQDGA